MVVNIFRDVTERKRLADARDFLAAASAVLSSSLDAETSLREVANLAVRTIADWCIVDLLDDDGGVHRVTVAHADPRQADLAARLRARDPILTARDAVSRVLRTGRPVLISDLTPEMIEEVIAHDPERMRLVRELGPRSLIVAALRARGRTLGAITLGAVDPARHYGQPELDLADDLAARVGLAIDNARLYRDAQEQADHQSKLNVALREAVQERDRALSDLHQALRTRDDFLASASHDLKNPLSSIKATAQLLLRRLDRPSANESDTCARAWTRGRHLHARRWPGGRAARSGAHADGSSDRARARADRHRCPGAIGRRRTSGWHRAARDPHRVLTPRSSATGTGAVSACARQHAGQRRQVQPEGGAIWVRVPAGR